MDWLSYLFFGFPAAFEPETERSAPPGQTDGIGLKIQRLLTRIGRLFRAAFKKARRLPRGVSAALAISGAVLLAAIFVYPARAKKILSHFQPSALFPSTGAPDIPGIDADALAIDPAAPPRRWRYVVIHHSASTRGSAQIFDQAHRDRGWRCLGYHFVIGNGTDQGDGIVAPGPRWYGQEAGAHAHSTEHNEFGIGICLVGNFDLKRPSAAQWTTLVNLVRTLCKRYGITPDNIVGHNLIRQGGSTACPGKNFPLQELREAVR